MPSGNATPQSVASFHNQAEAEGKKRAENVMPDPATWPIFRLGFIDGAYWGFRLAQELSERQDDDA